MDEISSENLGFVAVLFGDSAAGGRLADNVCAILWLPVDLRIGVIVIPLVRFFLTVCTEDVVE